jgi:hypothetical protein
MSGWQRIGVVISLLWLVGLPIYVMLDSNRRASNFYTWCRSVEAKAASDMRLSGRAAESTEQQHENCWRLAGFMSPTVLADTLIAGNADTVALWSLMLVPLVIFWLIAGIVFATVRRIRQWSPASSRNGSSGNIAANGRREGKGE